MRDARGRQLRAIDMPRPEQWLVETRGLPNAELEVIRGLVEGRSYAEIAALRGTSQRTIANQIAAAFKRLKVSGRNELIPRLFELEQRPASDDQASITDRVARRHPRTWVPAANRRP
ncbi:MAG TPA: helix-turn-helix transcriptional regulator [Polyangiaceae bacterium]